MIVISGIEPLSDEWPFYIVFLSPLSFPIMTTEEAKLSLTIIILTICPTLS